VRRRKRNGRVTPVLIAFAVLIVVAAAPPVGANTQQLNSDEPEAWAMFYFTSITLFSGFGTPRARKPWSLEAGAEIDSIPHLSAEQRTVGFGGTKEEDLNNAPVFGRPRLTVGLPYKLALSLSYVPPVKVFGLRPNLFALALERPLYQRGPLRFGMRTYGQIGFVKGALTCPSSVSRFPPGSSKNPYGCEGDKSNDKAIQQYIGVEGSGSYRIDALRGLEPYLTVGANFLNAKFHVHATTFDAPDRTHLSSDTWTVSLGAGLTYPLTQRIRIAAGVFYTPLWVTRPPRTSEESDSLVNARTEISYDFH